ncbi:MAG TPA: zf-HC2 domain-containing protein [Chloroflexia bacterium]|nr:zf-HC2 domain-containing protein [Chloroflexia bacterium]
MDCKAIRPLISYYYDGEVTPEESALVEQHLAECADCRQVLAEYRMIGSEMRDLPMPVPPTGLHRDVWRAIEAQGAIPQRAAARPPASPSKGKIVDFPVENGKRRPALASLATTLGNGWARALPAALLIAALGIMVAVFVLVQNRVANNDVARLADQGPYSNYAQQVQVQFSKSVLANSVTNNTLVFLVQGAISDTIVTTNTFDEKSRLLTIAPQPAWEPGAQYRISIDASKVLLSGVGTPLDTKPITLDFSTVAYTPTPTNTSVPPVYTSTTVPTSTPEPTQVVEITPGIPGGDTTATPQEEATVVVEPTATSTEVPVATDTPLPAPTDTAVPPVPTDTPTTEPTASPTDTPTPPLPTETATPQITATATPAQPCSIMPVNGFGKVWDENSTVHDQVGCPTEPEFALTEAAQERFEGGYMFWRKDIKKIYVFYGNPNTDTVGVWAEYDDTWDDGTPVATTTAHATSTSTATPEGTRPSTDATAVLTPPPGKYVPVRGFGELWANNPTVRARVGWAIEPEQSVIGAFQVYEHGYALWTNNKVIRFMFKVPGATENIWERFADTFATPTATP